MRHAYHLKQTEAPVLQMFLIIWRMILREGHVARMGEVKLV